MKKSLQENFLAHLAQTSLEPMGIEVTSAHGATVTSADGRSYIDLLAGIGVAALGHGNPRVLAAIARQAQRHLHVMVYGEFIQEAQVGLATALAELLPESLSSVYFTNSGAEAVEGALKLSRKASGRSRILSFVGGFHGDTLGAVSVGGNPVYRDPFGPLLPDVGFLKFNDFDGLGDIDHTVAAVIVEPVQAEAGVILPRPGWLAALRQRCSETGTLLIFDEVITGLGRSGTMFAFEGEGAVPDILLLAKALGGGLPLGAFVASPGLMLSLATDPPLGHVTTFGGHPLSCAAGLACLQIIREDGLARVADQSGAHLEGLLATALPTDMLVEVRRAGLLIGMEMATPALAASFTKACRQGGLILGWTLHNDRVVRLAPPLTISRAELEEAAARMSAAAAEL
ncbi:MAG: aspartate aminotransferase family protein [Deltaproteobacteria bacterium]